MFFTIKQKLTKKEKKEFDKKHKTIGYLPPVCQFSADGDLWINDIFNEIYKDRGQYYIINEENGEIEYLYFDSKECYHDLQYFYKKYKLGFRFYKFIQEDY